MPITAADLPATESTIYHLHLRPEELAPAVLLVGDPDRVPFLADELLTSREVSVLHRGLATITGTVRETGQRISIVTSGMGTPSLEIVLGELFALSAIDLTTRTLRRNPTRLSIIRVGTSGALQEETPLGTAIISTHALGLDNTALFYDAAPTCPEFEALESRAAGALRAALPEHARLARGITPYLAPADPEVVTALERAAGSINLTARRGLTVTNSGFFGNQGRGIFPFPIVLPEIDRIMAGLEGLNGLRFENMEMESSFLFYLGHALGYRVGSICPAIANRALNTFTDRHLALVRESARAATLALAELEQPGHTG